LDYTGARPAQPDSKTRKGIGKRKRMFGPPPINLLSIGGMKCSKQSFAATLTAQFLIPHRPPSLLLTLDVADAALVHLPLPLCLFDGAPKAAAGAPFGFSFFGFLFSRLPFCSRFAIALSFTAASDLPSMR
jgi:hypothetical protein